MNKNKLDGLSEALRENLLKRKEQKNNLKHQKQKLRKNKIDQIKEGDLFRNSITHLNLNYTQKSVLEISVFLLIFIFSFCVLNVKLKIVY